MSGEHQGLSSPATDRAPLLAELHGLNGIQIVDRILATDDPRALVQGLPSEDFFWLIKKVGEDDCLPVLELASHEQWQYMLDLEIWRRDGIDPEELSEWIGRLQEADSPRLIQWLFGEGQALVYYHVFKSVEVIILEEEEDAFDIPEGFFSVDGIFYIRAKDPEYREKVEALIRAMAEEDLVRYQALLQGLFGFVPAETEENMYRVRNVRLAEHGFLPFEEALSAYAPMDPQALAKEKIPSLRDLMHDEEIRELVPVSPLQQSGAANLLTESVSQIITDPLLLDRIRLEFAGLCNQILSADGIRVEEMEDLIKVSRKVAQYLNLGLERICARDLAEAAALLEQHPLLSIFRVGIGLSLKVKWEAERWLRTSWFYGQGLSPGFWGEEWGGILSGLLGRIPRFYTGFLEGEEYKDFEWVGELGDAMEAIRSMMVLDGLLERLAERFSMDRELLQSPEVTFHPLLFHFWGRQLLGLDPAFSGITRKQAKAFFGRLRGTAKGPPFDISSFKDAFVQDVASHAPAPDNETATLLKETLSVVWQQFAEEYAWVSLDDLDRGYSKFLTITKA